MRTAYSIKYVFHMKYSSRLTTEKHKQECIFNPAGSFQNAHFFLTSLERAFPPCLSQSTFFFHVSLVFGIYLSSNRIRARKVKFWYFLFIYLFYLENGGEYVYFVAKNRTSIKLTYILKIWHAYTIWGDTQVIQISERR